MANVTFGPHLLTENDIPGCSLSGRNPASLKNPELRFWLKCRGDSCKGLTTKSQPQAAQSRKVNNYKDLYGNLDNRLKKIFTRKSSQ